MPDKKKKIAIIIPKYGMAGGAERFAAIVTEKIAENPRYDIHVLANRWTSSSNAITFHRIPIIPFPRFLTSITFAWFANRAAARLGCELIHTHDRILHADIFTMHGVPHEFWVKKIRHKRMSLYDSMLSFVEKKLLRNPHCKVLQPVSTLARNQYQRIFPAIGGKIHVLHPGIDLESFHPRNRELHRHLVREKFGFAESDFVILFVGMNFELKGLRTLIASLPQAQAQVLHKGNLRLLVAGKGNQQRYERLAEELGVREAIRFAGTCNEKEMKTLYAAADLHALLSDFDTFGMTVLEAMATGIPVLISPMVGAKDFVLDGIQGYIVDQHDTKAVAERIVFLLDKAKRMKMGLAARQAAENHSWDLVAQKISRIYDEILATK